MAILKFENTSNNSMLGGKGRTLAQLSKEQLPVPPGLILTSPPKSKEEWGQIFNWWKTLNSPKLAIRSSALGEDSEEHSFAGQNLSFLNVSSEIDIKENIKKCFDSLNRQASLSYQKFFLDESKKPSMNVVLQIMVNPLFSGVYFSKDPRSSYKGAIFEVVEGLGESLVSGKVTPYFFSEEQDPETLPESWQPNFKADILSFGEKVKALLDYDLDMEWAIDSKGKFYILQARPITAISSVSSQKKFMDYEIKRLKKNYSPKTVWDGKTFAEWGGFPSYFTFSIWKNVFSPRYAFGKALKNLGYVSFVDKSYSPKDSALERVFGRAYINLDKVGSLYYGDMPYRMVGRPKPKLVFDWSKLSIMTILRIPSTLWRMVKVSINLSTQRKKWISKGRKKLLKFQTQLQRSQSPNYYKDWSTAEIFERLQNECKVFSKITLVYPLILVILSEATLTALTQILVSFYKDKKLAKNKLKSWLSYGLHTKTFEMNLKYKEASSGDEKVKCEFLEVYGHRGPGELDLINPRWSEVQNEAFTSSSINLQSKTHSPLQVEKEIQELNTLKKSVILQEWRILKELLELREQWKMEMLKPYAHIRFMLNELGQRLGLGLDVHWLRLSELKELEQSKDSSAFKDKIKDRKQRFHAFKKMSFPEVVSLSEIENIANGVLPKDFKALEGESLSSGMVLGTAVIVEDPSKINLDTLPEDFILVAEVIDPGWTPLLVKAKGVVLEKGGILSHCAILARELEIPAISRIYQVHKRIQTGDHIWVDGYNGALSYES